ncbi:class I mannose-6-phosphate isomerase [Cerasicoccus frondis]|uniref:class I mannose-6-phosphate isomerase n=1 Tax=Cerasicoccus frondis TaxID=490090 RepID=UPI0028528414|nr:class I mannose-6-phosphate isomerase [Cerasicoccus frondis]
MAALPPFFRLPPNRVWRSYLGGRFLDALEGKSKADDSHFPEDWIGSLTAAKNPPDGGGGDGVARVEFAGQTHRLTELLNSNPEYFLGSAHLARHGCDPRILIKYIDASIRLHLQVHPTAAFAQKHLNAPAGKTEAYYVLAARPEIRDPHLYLGFHTPPTKQQLKRWIEEQAIDSLLASMNRVAVTPADVLLVPGGLPHALGAGLFLVELQEASDLVVRFEFERGGYVLPEDSRFMGKGLDFCLDVFNAAPCTMNDIQATLRCPAKPVAELSTHARLESLIGPEQTDRFRLKQVHFTGEFNLPINAFTIAIVAHGACRLEAAGQSLSLACYDKCLLPHGAESIRIRPLGNEPAALLLCEPPA